MNMLMSPASTQSQQLRSHSVNWSVKHTTMGKFIVWIHLILNGLSVESTQSVSTPLIIAEKLSLILLHHILTKLSYFSEALHCVSTLLVMNKRIRKLQSLSVKQNSGDLRGEWILTPLMESTDLSVIGYVAQRCKNTL